VIRQAISCDICASEKKQTNHWFVAYELGGELRVSGWNSRNRLRPGSKHLCGQTCLHKLVDEFMAASIALRQPAEANKRSQVREESSAATDTSLTSAAAHAEIESSARLVAPVRATPLAPFKPPAELIAIQSARNTAEMIMPDEPTRFASRNWRAEAWKREREREGSPESRSSESRTDVGRRRLNA
jgi:hypothetical protein